MHWVSGGGCRHGCHATFTEKKDTTRRGNYDETIHGRMNRFLKLTRGLNATMTEVIEWCSGRNGLGPLSNQTMGARDS